MSPEQEALARRAVACAAWRWMPGMLDEAGRRVVLWERGAPAGVVVAQDSVDRYTQRPIYDGALPDCLLALVREAWGDPGNVEPEQGLRSWWCYDGDSTYMCAHPGAREKREAGGSCCPGGPCHAPAAGPSEAAALVAALESAPVRR